MARGTKNFSRVVFALFCAIVVALTFIPYAGYFSYGVLSITTLHVVVILGIVVLEKPIYGTGLGLVWGITCLVYAFSGITADGAIFMDPRISVLPRILVGLFTSLVFILAKKLFKRIKGSERLSMGVAAVIGTLLNTFFVLTAISLFGTGFVSLGATLTQIYKTTVTINGLVELGLAVVIVPVVGASVKKNLKA
ncbi:MAG: hypothetical protein Q4B04_00065 [bacterium]|nr:hypothetical protein [bacterium]